MKEPVYECEMCGTTLERWEQGKYIWCSRCRQIWDDGFSKGIQYYDEFTSVDGMLGMALMYDRIAPYKVKE